jgi:hypothetical protein
MPSGRNSDDPIVPAYRAVVVAMIFELLSGNIFTGPSGAMLWTCIGLGLSLHQAEKVSLSPQSVGPFAPADLAVSDLVA